MKKKMGFLSVFGRKKDLLEQGFVAECGEQHVRHADAVGIQFHILRISFYTNQG